MLEALGLGYSVGCLAALIPQPNVTSVGEEQLDDLRRCAEPRRNVQRRLLVLVLCGRVESHCEQQPNALEGARDDRRMQRRVPVMVYAPRGCAGARHGARSRAHIARGGVSARRWARCLARRTTCRRTTAPPAAAPACASASAAATATAFASASAAATAFASASAAATAFASAFASAAAFASAVARVSAASSKRRHSV